MHSLGKFTISYQSTTQKKSSSRQVSTKITSSFQPLPQRHSRTLDNIKEDAVNAHPILEVISEEGSPGPNRYWVWTTLPCIASTLHTMVTVLNAWMNKSMAKLKHIFRGLSEISPILTVRLRFKCHYRHKTSSGCQDRRNRMAHSTRTPGSPFLKLTTSQTSTTT